MRQAIALFLCVSLAYPAGLIAAADSTPIQTASELINKPYLELLELGEIGKLSSAEVETIERQLKREQEAEQNRLKKEEERIEKELKTARRHLQEINRRASRDDAETAKQRGEMHCQVERLETQLAKVKTEREKGVPISFQNKFAKLESIQKWPAVRADIERKIEEGRARERRYGDVEDIGFRNLGIENLAQRQYDDIKTGQDAIREMKAQRFMPPEVEDKDLTAYIQRLADKIARNSDLKVPVKVTILDSDEINAFALPGGFLFVNTGLIKKAETESELAGVLAHEIAHAAARHGARLNKRATITDALFQAAQVGALIITGGAAGIGTYYAFQYGFQGLGMILDLTLLGVSRDFEAEADQLGAQYAWQAGYDPKGFITFFDKMANEEGQVKSTSFFRTHPPFLERIVSTFSEITYLPPKKDLRADSSDFADAKKRAAELIKKREDEDRNKPSLREKQPECGEISMPISE